MKSRFIKNLIPSRPRSPRERGQSLALLAIALPAFIAAVGLAMDVGNFYFNDYKAQKAVDAAALAGATCNAHPTWTSCSSPSTPSSVATDFATSKNFLLSSELNPNPVAAPTSDPLYCPSSWTPPLNTCEITVNATRTVPYYFARLAGTYSGTLKVTGVAIGGPINTVTGDQNLMPIGLQYTTVAGFSAGAAVSGLAANGTSGCAGSPPICPSGDWGWVSLDGSGHATVDSEIQNGYSGTIAQGTATTTCPSDGCILPQPGVGDSFSYVSTYRAASSAAACSGQTWSDHPPDSPCAVTVVLVDYSQCSGGRCPSGIPVVGFAELWINTVTGHGSSSNITATWISDTVPGGGLSGSGPQPVIGGAVAVKLVR